MVEQVEYRPAKWVELGKMPMMTDKPEVEVKGTQTLMRALDIMDEVIGGPIRAADLARKLGMSKTTAHRLVQALKSRGYLSVTNDGFGLGPKLLELGVMATEQIDFVRVARPFMEKLSDETGFCVFVGKREDDWSRHLDRRARSPAPARGDRARRSPTDRRDRPRQGAAARRGRGGLGRALPRRERRPQWRQGPGQGGQGICGADARAQGAGLCAA